MYGSKVIIQNAFPRIINQFVEICPFKIAFAALGDQAIKSASFYASLHQEGKKSMGKKP